VTQAFATALFEPAARRALQGSMASERLMGLMA